MDIINDKFIQHVISINDSIMLHIIQQSNLSFNNDQHIFSYLIGLIIGQKITFQKAKQMRSRLYSIFNSRNFTPQQILNLTSEQWNIINVGNKKQIILDVSAYAMDKDMYDVNVIKQMTSIKGIGPWTISCLMIEYRMLNDEFPLNDVYVNKKLKELYNIDISNINNIRTFVKKWSPYKSIAFYYLWKFNI
jgi:DNA-3-methyladenine glycosylase II